MSAQGMARTVLATGLQQALAKDVAAGRIGFVAKEFGPNVQAWLREVAEGVAPADHECAGEFTGDARKLAEGITSAAKRAGIYNGEVALSGPILLQLLDHMVIAATAQPQPRPPEDLERRLEVHYQLALASTMPQIRQQDVPRWWYSLGFRAAAQEVPRVHFEGDLLGTSNAAVEAGGQVADRVEALLASLAAEDAARGKLSDTYQEPELRQAAAHAHRARAAVAADLDLQAGAFRQAHQRAQEARAALEAAFPLRAVTEDDLSRLDGKTVVTPIGERQVRFVDADHNVLCTDGSRFPMRLLQMRGQRVVHLDEGDWKSVVAAARRSKWMPPEYMVNEWLSDVCRFLEHGPSDDIESAIDEVAKEWDGCTYDSVGGSIDIGQALRDAGKRLVEGKTPPAPQESVKERQA